MSIYQFITDNAKDIEVNLFASALALAIDLFLTLIIIDRFVKNRDNARWLPVKSIVISQIAKTYHTLFNACYQLTVLSQDKTGYPPYEAASLFVRYADAEFGRLRTLADLNSIALGPDLLPDCAMFLDKTEVIIRDLNFFKEFYNQKRGNQEIVGVPPFSEIAAIEGIAKRIQARHPKLLDLKAPRTPETRSSTEIVEKWGALKDNSNRLYFDVGKYVGTSQKKPLLKDGETIRSMHSGPNQLEIFYG